MPYLCLLRHGRPDRLRKRLPRRKLLQLRRGQRGGRNGGRPDRPGQQPFDKRARKSLLPRGFLRYRRRRQGGGIRTAARTAAEFAALSFLRQLDKNGCFVLENGAYPELSASARCAHLETELRDARAATCTEAGYTGDTVCKACGMEITHGEVIPAAGHQYRNGACTVCGAKDPRWSGPERRGTIRSATFV